jgi:hypothetical protein
MEVERASGVDPRVVRAARAVLAAAAAMPEHSGLGAELGLIERAAARGYFLPDEDDRVRAVYARHLTTRAVLIGALEVVEPLAGDDAGGWAARYDAFLVAFAAACLLVRSAHFLTDLACERPVLWKKLDEPEPRHGIPYQTFSRLFRAATAPRRLARFRAAVDFYRGTKAEAAARAADDLLGPVVALLAAEEPWLPRRRELWRRIVAHGWFAFLRSHHSGYRRTMFHLFRLGGLAVADLRQPGFKPRRAPKRIGPGERAALLAIARPGDVFLSRHDDALSNWFLPGYWPHASLHLGSVAARARIGLVAPPSLAARVADPVCFLEAKKDGVRFRPAEDTLAVDACVVFRPGLAAAAVAEALLRAMSHEGKPYDFLFDFRKTDRLACTEVIYRGFHGVAGIDFRLREVAGRMCLPAEELAAQLLESGFEVVAVQGASGDGLVTGPGAAEVYRQSVRRGSAG